MQSRPDPAPALPVADDHHIDAPLDIALSTPSSLVVHASLEVEAGPDASGNSLTVYDLALVIPRSRCQGERPRLAALLDAAQAAVARATRGGALGRPFRVLTQVGGRPHLIPLYSAC